MDFCSYPPAFLIDGKIFFGNLQKKLARIVPFGGKIGCSMDRENQQNGCWLPLIDDFRRKREPEKYSYGASARLLRFLFFGEILKKRKN